jgi:hypothetical protein
MNTLAFRDWFRRKVELCDKIIAIAKGYEEDAEILLCCAVSALAAKLWINQKDKFRFVEFLVRFTPPSFNITKISIPTLIGFNKKCDVSSKKLRDNFYPPDDSLILHGSQIDKFESDITKLLPNIPLKDIRKSSYANIIYSDLRCGLIHEYRVRFDNMRPWGMSAKKDEPSYDNDVIIPDIADVKKMAAELKISEKEATMRLTKSKRVIYIPYGYLRNALTGAANNAFNYWDSASSFSIDKPTLWWIEGGIYQSSKQVNFLR